jgi:chromosome segregation ATPase
MFADYQEFAATFARRCRERRNAEEEQQHELDELTKPAAALPTADVCKSNGAGVLVHKVRDNSRIADDSSAAERTLSARTNSKQSWWEWVDERIGQHLEPLNEVIGQAMAEWVGQKVDPIKRELALTRREPASLRDEVERERALSAKAADIERTQRETEYDLLRRELAVLRGEVGVERRLQALKAEIAVAKAEIPQVPAIEARVTAELAAHKTEIERLEAQLKTTKDRLSNLRDYTLTQMERKQAKRAAPEPAIEIKLETSATQFVMRDIDPAAMDAWRNFVAGMLQAQQDAETTLSITRATGATGQVVALPVRKNGNAA